jgi:hypothetical protein
MGAAAVASLVSLAAATLLAGSLAGTAWAEGPAPAALPNKIECIAADTEGQSLRLAGKLLDARRRLAACAAASCPSIVRDDCVERIADLEAAQPTVVFTATNGDGRRLVAVRVTVDGIVAANRLDGRPLPVDPGDHLFVFDALGRVTAQMRLTLHEGQKRVGHAVVLHAASGDPVAAVPTPEPVATSADQGASSDLLPPATLAAPAIAPTAAEQEAPAPAVGPADGDAGGLSEGRIVAIVAGGVGVVGVVVGSVFGLETISAWHAAQRDCGATSKCPTNGPKIEQEEGDASKDGTISTFAFVAGGVGLALGAWLWFTTPERSRSQVSVVPIAGPSQGELMVRGRF